jgi:hypothetical protein
LGNHDPQLQVGAGPQGRTGGPVIRRHSLS